MLKNVTVLLNPLLRSVDCLLVGFVRAAIDMTLAPRSS